MQRINWFHDPNATRHRRRGKRLRGLCSGSLAASACRLVPHARQRLRAEDQIREIWRREWEDWKLLTGKEFL